MRNVVLALLAVVGAALAAAGQAEGAVTATGIRIGDHPAFVRVVVDFSGGRIRDADVEATDPSPFADGRASVRVSKTGIQAGVRVRSAFGVRARLRQGTNRIVLRITTAPRRFKYLGYVVYRGPERLVVDLWKARPPVAGASFTTAPQGGCLTLDSWSVGAGRATAAGRERNIFEHMFQVGLRKANGRVARMVGVTGFAGAWSRTFGYSVSRLQAGTLEAVDLSEKDGSLACIAQVRVLLRPPS
ncbi:MAG TPA: hypothetical protein VD769_12435 [Gaiellaceae bacterium]|nr:hypothetical protein [Gaiellaceae bacterium]